MLVAAAVCPHPPLLVPEVAGAAAPELDHVRAACRHALGRLLGARADHLVVVGRGAATETYDVTAGGSLADYGADVRVGPGRAVLPLSLTIGRWLLDGAPARPRTRDEVLLQSVAGHADPLACHSLGASLGARADRVGMLVMGDGSAYRDAGDRVGSRARDFDADVARALAAGDATGLTRLDARLADELSVAGRVAWQVLAGAAAGSLFGARLLVDAAPYGVGYLVATWTRA